MGGLGFLLVSQSTVASHGCACLLRAWPCYLWGFPPPATSPSSHHCIALLVPCHAMPYHVMLCRAVPRLLSRSLSLSLTLSHSLSLSLALPPLSHSHRIASIIIHVNLGLRVVVRGMGGGQRGESCPNPVQRHSRSASCRQEASQHDGGEAITSKRLLRLCPSVPTSVLVNGFLVCF
ncbi:hypothetical protein LZ30DRAFT_185686 [Colletotrichum cereale]|nr:hypothetical protein LZ30DRAFT_185686 [Colletotrichum cereale]